MFRVDSCDMATYKNVYTRIVKTKLIVIVIILAIWFTCEELLDVNTFSHIETFKIRENVKSLSLFIAYLFFSFLPLIFYPSALNKFLKYVVIVIVPTVVLFFLIANGADLAPNKYDTAVLLSLLYIPISLVSIYLTKHASHKL